MSHLDTFGRHSITAYGQYVPFCVGEVNQIIRLLTNARANLKVFLKKMDWFILISLN